jgi:hypothetical protein
MSSKPYNKGVKKMRGRPFDEFHCFFIKDFRKGDSIRVSLKSKEQRFVKGVVTSVDTANCLIHYKTAGCEDNVTTINYIVSLEDFKKDFLTT